MGNCPGREDAEGDEEEEYIHVGFRARNRRFIINTKELYPASTTIREWIDMHNISRSAVAVDDVDQPIRSILLDARPTTEWSNGAVYIALAPNYVMVVREDESFVGAFDLRAGSSVFQKQFGTTCVKLITEDQLDYEKLQWRNLNNFKFENVRRLLWIVI